MYWTSPWPSPPHRKKNVLVRCKTRKDLLVTLGERNMLKLHEIWHVFPSGKKTSSQILLVHFLPSLCHTTLIFQDRSVAWLRERLYQTLYVPVFLSLSNRINLINFILLCLAWQKRDLLTNVLCDAFFLQRQLLRAVPVSEIHYQWNETSSRFWVYGHDHKVYAPDYPQKCCCGCSIL